MVSDLQRRLSFQNKAKARAASPTASPTNRKAVHGLGTTQTDLIESLGRLTSCLSELLRSNLEVSSSRLSHPTSSDPLISMITNNGTRSSNETPRASGQRGVRQVPRLMTAKDFEQPSVDHVAPFVKTVQTLMGSDLCCRLFESSELRVSLNCLQGIRAGLEELSVQRAFEWTSGLVQEGLPHHSINMPADSLTTEARKSVSSRRRTKDYEVGSQRASKNSIACREVQKLLGSRLTELAVSFRVLYRFVGSILGGVYDDSEIQSELTDASLLGSYVSMVSRHLKLRRNYSPRCAGRILILS